MTTDRPNKRPRLRIEVGRHYDNTEKEDAVVIRIAAKPGFGAFWQSLAPKNLPGYGLIRNTPIEPLARMANFWLLPVTALLAPDGMRVDVQTDEPDMPSVRERKSAKKQSGGEVGRVTDLDWNDVSG